MIKINKMVQVNVRVQLLDYLIIVELSGEQHNKAKYNKESDCSSILGSFSFLAYAAGNKLELLPLHWQKRNQAKKIAKMAKRGAALQLYNILLTQ